MVNQTPLWPKPNHKQEKSFPYSTATFLDIFDILDYRKHKMQQHRRMSNVKEEEVGSRQKKMPLKASHSCQ